jgi:hypothetical protein
LNIVCRNCRSAEAKPYNFSTRFCTEACMLQYEKRAEAVGGYHVLARDETIKELREELETYRDCRGCTEIKFEN